MGIYTTVNSCDMVASQRKDPALLSDRARPKHLGAPRAPLWMALLALVVSVVSCGGTDAPPAGDGSGAAPADGSGGAASGGGPAETGGASSGDGGSATGGSGAGTSTGGSSSGVPEESEVTPPSEPVSPFLVVDQFGYLEDSEKIAVLRDPDVGFDAAESYTPAASYQIKDAVSGETVLELEPAAWNGGAVHGQSGDRAFWLDFSALEEPGVYYILDPEAGVRSDLFRIASDVYRRVFRHALRTFYYQRAGFAKETPYAEEGWTDAASHVGPGQDTEARLFGQEGNASTERDLSGGWYDAGDYNRYTPWTADYVVTLLRMYEETPSIFGDDLGIPESGNGVPDVLDEARFGLAHLEKLQLDSGGCLSVLGVGSGSPPSAATDPSVYGPETTNATIRAGLAFAWGARIFATSDPTYATSLLERAERAWTFAEENPNLVFNNSGNVAAGEQQSSAEDVLLYQLGFAVALHRAGAEGADYKSFFEESYDSAGLQLLGGYNAAWQLQFTEYYLDYAALPDADEAIAAEIQDAFRSTITSGDNLGILEENQDAYLAHVADYTWGSNAHKSRTGCLLYDLVQYDLDPARNADARSAAARYVHYLHGVNPLGLVYLSNMGSVGAQQSVTTFFHSWFADQSPEWDEVGISTYGPPPGFLAGGPNPSYDWDGVCPGQELCPAARPSPPYGQPAQKSYAQFNDSWPVNSWSVTENSNGYQVYYLRLLAKFVH